MSASGSCSERRGYVGDGGGNDSTVEAVMRGRGGGDAQTGGASGTSFALFLGIIFLLLLGYQGQWEWELSNEAFSCPLWRMTLFLAHYGGLTLLTRRKL